MQIDDERLAPFRAIGRGRATPQQLTAAGAAGAEERPLRDPDGPVLLAGDWHGNTPYALKVLRYAETVGARTVVQLGDFGVCDDGEGYLDVLSAQAEDSRLTLLFVDGNHEDFPLLHRFPVLEHEDCPRLRLLRPRLWHLPRGTRWTWSSADGTPWRWLAVGGAASVDRASRTEGYSWWPQEELTETEAEHIAAGGRADVVVCHDRPQSAAITLGDLPGQWWARAPWAWAREDLARSDQHSARLQRVVDAVRPSNVWHGHLHRRTEVPLHPDDWDNGCTVHGLSADGTPVEDSCALVGVDGAAVDGPPGEAKQKGWAHLPPPLDIDGPSSEDLLRELRGDR